MTHEKRTKMLDNGNSFGQRLLDKFLFYNHIDKEHIHTILTNFLENDGVLGLSLMDRESGIIISSLSRQDTKMTVATEYNNEIITAIKNMVFQLYHEKQDIKDISIIHKDKIEITMPIDLGGRREFFFYLIIDSSKTNIVLMRNKVVNMIEVLKN